MLVRVLTLVAAMVVVSGVSKPAEASEGFSFGYYGPGYAFFPGHYPRHVFYPHIYKPYHYFHYGPGLQSQLQPPQKHPPHWQKQSQRTLLAVGPGLYDQLGAW